MGCIKVNLHSAVDVITNSSTTIFTYSGGSDKKAIELIDGLLGVVGSDMKAKDMFHIGVFVEDFDYYLEFIGDVYWKDGEYSRELMEEDECDEDFIKLLMDEIDIDDIVNKVLKCEIEKPQWMIDAEEYEGGYDDYSPSTTLFIFPKKEEYADVAEMISNFLYSTSHEAVYGG